MTAAPVRILVVDDDATARLLMRAALHKCGYEVTLAQGGEDALRQFRAHVFDMIMLDIDMPDLSGHAVCATIRAEVGHLLPILMVTGMNDVQSVECAYRSGATDFISKPMNWALIGHRVKYLLRGHQVMLDLRAVQARNAAILGAIPDLLFELDIDGRYISYHAPRSDLRALPCDAIIGRTVAEVLPPAAARVCLLALQAANATGSSTGMQFELPLANGTGWFELSVSRKGAGLEVCPHFIVLSRDITERKEAERKILRLAFFDSLTGLPNRPSFLDRVDREINRARHTAARFGVLFMDLDGFKNINDTMGHSAGDLALQWTADRLREAVRSADLVSRGSAPGVDVAIARLGGDEFTALILDIKHPEDALAIASRILLLMHQPFMLNDLEVMLTTSIGIALYPEDGEDSASLLKHADTALYHAKDSGRDNCQFYRAALTETAMQRMQLECDLRLALERNEFSLLYQPQMDVVAGRMQSVEALIRWQRPGCGMVLPQEFIPMAEQCGLIVPIGQWVLRTACTAAASWQRDGHLLRVAVNLSPLQFKDPHLVQMVFEVLAETGLAPELLELEVTESAVMEDSAATLARLNALRARGVRMALDDFGTGYSSLSYLKRLPLGKLKVDRSFVIGLPDDHESYAIVCAILAMANSLGLSVTAEGVETAEQVQVLMDLACHSMQGNYFSQPVAAAEIPALFSPCWSFSAMASPRYAPSRAFEARSVCRLLDSAVPHTMMAPQNTIQAETASCRKSAP
jgi:diguanylate cyclase (GGDEF)-like protein